jgi:ABC-type glycerol-3-phosphate transport system permease component
MYVYKIFRLVIIALLITYFLGCFWYLISTSINYESDIIEGNTFVTHYGLNTTSDPTKLLVSCYFVLTTLATVGYGDFFPISTIERVLSVVIMLCGVAFFSYIMNSFIEIISNYQKKMGAVDKTTDLQRWMLMLTRFTR